MKQLAGKVKRIINHSLEKQSLKGSKKYREGWLKKTLNLIYKPYISLELRNWLKLCFLIQEDVISMFLLNDAKIFRWKSNFVFWQKSQTSVCIGARNVVYIVKWAGKGTLGGMIPVAIYKSLCCSKGGTRNANLMLANCVIYIYFLIYVFILERP